MFRISFCMRTTRGLWRAADIEMAGMRVNAALWNTYATSYSPMNCTKYFTVCIRFALFSFPEMNRLMDGYCTLRRDVYLPCIG